MVEPIVRTREMEFEPGRYHDRVVGGESTVGDESVDGVSDELEVFSCHAYIVPEGGRVSTPKRRKSGDFY